MPTQERNLRTGDPDVYNILSGELQREQSTLELIPSENYASPLVLEALGSVLTNKYAEGYPHKRYYGGNEFSDAAEDLAIKRAKDVFGFDHANVQPYSGSPANLAVYYALCQPGDVIMGMHLPDGGHLTHGWKVNFSSKFYHSVPYALDPETGRINYDTLWKLAKENRPRLIWSGGTAYPRIFEFDKFAQIAQDVGALFVADIAHVAGLVIAGLHPDPVPYADAVTMTTHKILRGPRAGLIGCREQHVREIDRAIFPSLQGGPHENTIAAIAVCLGEASTEEYKEYCRRVVQNARVLAEELLTHDFDLVTGGTDNHMILIDLTRRGTSGQPAEQVLDRAGITVNKNMIVNDPRKPLDPSGIRIGTPALTTRGMGPDEMRMIASWMDTVLRHADDDEIISRVRGEVEELCGHYPLAYASPASRAMSTS